MPARIEREEMYDALREVVSKLPRDESDSYESIKADLLAFCEAKIDEQLKNARAGQGIIISVYAEIVNPDLTFESERQRNSLAAQEWRKAVYERDGYACRDCGIKGDIQAHHIEEWAVAPTKRFDVDNGLTLCIEHHCARHPRHAHLIRNSKQSRHH